MPKNLTRREFMKDLGLFGAAATLAPRVAFGEQESDTAFAPERPSYVKEIDEPTSGIDWVAMKRYNERETVRRGFTGYVGEETVEKLSAKRAENMDRWLKEEKPGYTLKDRALAEGSGVGYSDLSFIGSQKADTPEDLGVPKWTGTPEEASQIVSAALRHYGAATIGFVELDTNTTEKLIYSIDPDGKVMNIEDVDEPAEDDESRTIPKKARSAIVYTVQMSEETFERAPTPLYSQTTTLTYRRARNIQDRLQNFLRGLGYMGLGEASTNALGIAPAFGVMAGLGEMSRLNRLLTPEYGPMVRVFKLLTDLPLAPTKPIDAGLWDFCRTCKKCADHCPVKNLSFSDPTWEVKGGWNNPGHEAYFENSVACRSYWYEVGTNCGICFAVCPFSSKDETVYSRLRNYLAGRNSLVDNALVSVDDLLYTPYTELGKPQKSPETWWLENLPDYGIDTMLTVRETS